MTAVSGAFFAFITSPAQILIQADSGTKRFVLSVCWLDEEVPGKFSSKGRKFSSKRTELSSRRRPPVAWIAAAIMYYDW
jgi:hypothetical protein